MTFIAQGSETALLPLNQPVTDRSKKQQLTQLSSSSQIIGTHGSTHYINHLEDLEISVKGITKDPNILPPLFPYYWAK